MLLEAPFRQLAEVARRSEAELPTTFSSKRLSLPAVGARAPAPPAGVSTLTTPAGAGPPFRARRFEGRFEGRLGAEWVAGDEPAVGASTLTPCSCRCLVAGLTCPAACALRSSEVIRGHQRSSEVISTHLPRRMRAERRSSAGLARVGAEAAPARARGGGCTTTLHR